MRSQVIQLIAKILEFDINLHTKFLNPPSSCYYRCKHRSSGCHAVTNASLINGMVEIRETDHNHHSNQQFELTNNFEEKSLILCLKTITNSESIPHQK